MPGRAESSSSAPSGPEELARERDHQERYRLAGRGERVTVQRADRRGVARLRDGRTGVAAAAEPTTAAAAAALLLRAGRRIAAQVPRDAVQVRRDVIARQLDPAHLLSLVVANLDRHLRVAAGGAAEAVGEERAIGRVLVGR